MIVMLEYLCLFTGIGLMLSVFYIRHSRKYIRLAGKITGSRIVRRNRYFCYPLVEFQDESGCIQSYQMRISCWGKRYSGRKLILHKNRKNGTVTADMECSQRLMLGMLLAGACLLLIIG